MKPQNLKISILGACALSLFGCSYYTTSQMGTGEFADKEVVRCSHQIFTFPLYRTHTRIDHTLVELGLKQSDVYSVEKRIWPWLFPIYFNYCNVISLNKEGAKKVADADSLDYISAVEESRKEAAEQAAEAQGKKTPGKNSEFPKAISVDDCEKYGFISRDRCRKEVESRQ